MKYVLQIFLFSFLSFCLLADDKADFNKLKETAETGDAKAQCELAVCYLYGKGIEKNESKAFDLFLSSSEQGNEDAQTYLGNCCLWGVGTPGDHKKAFEYFSKAAGQGKAYSQRQLGLCYGKGIGVEVDKKKAFEWFEKAADQGDLDALVQMACYNMGAGGFEVDSKKAMERLEKAAERGSVMAGFYSACAYFNGYCIMVDDCEDSVVVGRVTGDTDKSIKYAKKMVIGSHIKSVRYVSAFLLMAGYVKKGDLKGAMKAVHEYPFILFAICTAYLALAGGFVLLLFLILWIYSKSRLGGCDGGPWRLFDFFLLLLIMIPFALVTQVLLLLPFHLLASALIQMVILFGFGIVFFAIIIRGRGASFKDAFALKDVRIRTLLVWTLMFAIGVIAIEVAYLWGCGLLGIKLKPQALSDLISSKSLSGFNLVFAFVVCSLVVPVMEELIFRGIIYQSLKTKMRPWMAIAISSAIFASMHMSLSFFLILFAMGAIFAYSLEKTKSLYVPICLHCLNNAVAVAIAIAMR